MALPVPANDNGLFFRRQCLWVALPDRYDDGACSGATIDRPALQRLMADVRAGRVNTIVVYKIDRLSRSLLDFTKLVEELERHAVSLVAVTSTSTPRPAWSA